VFIVIYEYFNVLSILSKRIKFLVGLIIRSVNVNEPSFHYISDHSSIRLTNCLSIFMFIIIYYVSYFTL